MRRDEPDLPYSKSRPVSYDHSYDRNLTFHAGRYFRNEASIRIPKHTVTPDERATMDAHRVAEAEARQAHADAALARAVELGAALKVLAGKDD